MSWRPTLIDIPGMKLLVKLWLLPMLFALSEDYLKKPATRPAA
jgi:hypothetical protein